MRRDRQIEIPPKADGYGSSASECRVALRGAGNLLLQRYLPRGGEVRGIQVERVEVEVDGDFEHEGGAATNVTYRARVKADASKDDVLDLMQHTDTVAEIQNTLRAATPVELSACEVLD